MRKIVPAFRWAGIPGILIGAGLLVLPPGAAFPHKTSLARSLIEVRGRDVAFTIVVSAHDLAVALGIPTDLKSPVPRAAFEERTDRLTAYLRARLGILAGQAACGLERLVPDYSLLPAEVRLPARYRCPSAVAVLGIRYRLFFDIDPTHRNLGRLEIAPGVSEAFLFDRSFTEMWTEIGSPPAELSFWNRFGRVVLLGVEHILLGYDHLLFLLALIIVSARFIRLLTVVTAFTVAHSITLALAWYEVVALPGRLVESLIALSIAYVAVENLLHKEGRHRWLISFAFGLVHGIGFYIVLTELELTGGACGIHPAGLQSRGGNGTDRGHRRRLSAPGVGRTLGLVSRAARGGVHDHARSGGVLVYRSGLHCLMGGGKPIDRGRVSLSVPPMISGPFSIGQPAARLPPHPRCGPTP